MVTYTGRNTTRELPRSTTSGTYKCSTNMRLFGLPFQFAKSVDPRMTDVSEVVGINYIRNIMMDAPTCYIIPGKAKFLPGSNNKTGLGVAFLDANNSSGGSDGLRNLLAEVSNDPDEKLRFYDFEEAYDEYMHYVNLMCRTVASFLNITDTITVGGVEKSFESYDWKNYRWTASEYKAGQGILTASRSIASNLWDSITGAPKKIWNMMRGVPAVEVDNTAGNNGESLVKSMNFVQFYIDPQSSATQNMSNQTGASFIKQALDTATGAVRDISFISNSAGVDTSKLQNFGESSMSVLNEMLGESDGPIGKVLGQIFSVGTSVIKGENVILPEIYQSSDYGIDYAIDIHLKAPYGNTYTNYMEVLVPLLHILALVLPRQGSSNSFGSPFLIKCYYPGVFNCNLGIVESVQINRPSDDSAWSNDGLPTEIDVQIRIKDLYSDLMLSPSTDMGLFRNNTNLIDYLATLAGLDLMTPHMDTKLNMLLTNYVNKVTDVPMNVKTTVLGGIERALSGFISL